MTFELAFDKKAFLKTKRTDKYIPAHLSFVHDDGREEVKTIRLKARGKSRKEICYFPPIALNIKKTEMENTYWSDVKKVKLVTHCSTVQSNVDNILKEYLIYKLYQELTPNSFRARLARITYRNTRRKNKTLENWAFIIEPVELLAKRQNMLNIKIDHIGNHDTDTLETAMMSTFQYMIGNEDFSIGGRHNMKLLKPNVFDKPMPVPVPYDFDYSGMINASYAQSRQGLDMEGVYQRYFLGPCLDREIYQQVFDLFVSKKDALYQVIVSFEWLTEREKKPMLEYLDEFYAQLGQPYFYKTYLESTCQ